MSRHERAPGAASLSAPRALTDGDMVVLGLMPNASNYTFLARCTDGHEEVLAVYKPRRGEIPLWDFPDGTLHRREVAAYALSRELGWPNVPPTVLRDGPEGWGSAQLFIPFVQEQHAFTLETERSDDLRRIALFDIVANNADRKAGHCLLGEDGHVYVIDHGVCFSTEPKLRTVLWSYIGETIPPELRADLARLEGELDDSPVARELRGLLEPEELEALAARLRRLLALGTFPEPEPGTRPYPWPPI